MLWSHRLLHGRMLGEYEALCDSKTAVQNWGNGIRQPGDGGEAFVEVYKIVARLTCSRRIITFSYTEAIVQANNMSKVIRFLSMAMIW